MRSRAWARVLGMVAWFCFTSESTCTMNVISVLNTKGGVGKTVTTIHLGASLAARGQRVMLIDIDLQHGLSTYFNAQTGGRATISDVLLRGAGIDEAMQELRDGLSLVPATAAMENAEVELSASAGSEVRLRRALNRFAADYDGGPDWVLIDCPSGYGAVTRNALIASSWMLVPINSEPASVYTAISTIAAARELAEYHERNLQLLGVVMTRWRQTNSARLTLDIARKEWGESLFETTIRQAERINDLSHAGATLHDISQSSGGDVARDYEALTGEVMQRGQTQTR